MASTKRKGAVAFKSENGNAQKKPRIEEKPGKKTITKLAVLETATDSDPIVESDTTSQSGEDDGVSWPCDDDGEPDEWAGVEEDNKTGGMKTAKEAAITESKRTAANGTMNGTEQLIPCVCPFLTVSTGGSSKEAHAKQKVEKQERRAAKPNADSIARSKKLWEKLRRKSHVPKEERKLLVAELFDIITGRVKDFVFKHDSVRVIQTALKYANPDQRKMIARELKGEYRTLAESRYAKFLVGKMLVHGEKETRDLIVPEFYGQVRRLIKHPEASWILDDIYRGIATPSQKATMLREWYGAEYALVKPNKKGATSADLVKLLAEHPEKRTPIMRSLHDLINLLIQKKTTGFTMLHDAMLQYILNIHSGSEEMTNFIDLLKGDEEGDLLKNLAFTESGARVVCLALAYGNAKDRKQIIKTYRDTIQALAYDAYGHRVLMAIYDVVDDTKLVSKSIFAELVGPDPSSSDQQQKLLTAVENISARVPLLYPFCGHTKAILSSEDIKTIAENHRIRDNVAGTSKKNPEVRRKELISSLSQPLLLVIASNVQTLVSTSFGCQFISEVLLEASGDRKPAINAICDIASGSKEKQALLNSPHAGRMLKRLVDGGRFNQEKKCLETVDPPLNFHNLFYEAIKDDVVTWATGSNSFVVVGLLEAPGFSKVETLKETLGKSKCKQALIAAAGNSEPGAIEKKGGEKAMKINESAGQEKGNRGTQLLLQKLGLVLGVEAVK